MTAHQPTITSQPGSRPRSSRSRMARNRVFTIFCWCIASTTVLVLAVLLTSIIARGLDHLDLAFLSDPPSRNAESAGLGPAMWGSVWLCAVCGAFALPLGIGTAIFLEEYKPRHPLVRKLHGFVQLNISNLAGVPSIVYGILGITVFAGMLGLFGSIRDPGFEMGVTWYDQFVDESGEYLSVRVDDRDSPPTAIASDVSAADDDGEGVALRILPEPEINDLHAAFEARAAGLDDDARAALSHEMLGGVVRSDVYIERVPIESWWYIRLPLGRGVLAGGLTLMLVVLPIVIISSQEAFRSVPNTLREGALGMGATKWQMVWRMTLPAAVPGIMTGSILAMSRAIGEAAPVLILAGIVYITFTPKNLMDDFTALPLQIYNWASLPQEEFHKVAATGIIVLLAVLLSFNALAVLIRQKFQKPLQ